MQIFIYTKVYVLGQLEQMLRAFRLAAPKEDDDDDMVPDEEGESAYGRLIQYCVDLFAFRQECSDHDAAEEFLSEKSDSELLSCFDNWLALIYQELVGSDTTKNKIVKECVTVQSVNKFVAPFVCSTPEPSIEGSRLESCPYPIVEAVEVAFDSRMLGAKNILKDVPGLEDTNTLHVDRAHMALKDADKVMLVYKKTRIVNNKKLYGVIRDIYRTRGPHGVFLVITHCAVSYHPRMEVLNKQSYKQHRILPRMTTHPSASLQKNELTWLHSPREKTSWVPRYENSFVKKETQRIWGPNADSTLKSGRKGMTLRLQA